MIPAALTVYVVPSALVLVGSACGALWGKLARRPKSQEGDTDAGDMSPELSQAYNHAARSKKPDPTEIAALCIKLRRAGFSEQADKLKKRMNLASVSPEVHERRRLAVKKAFSSADPIKVNQFAQILEEEGALQTAKALRAYAAGLKSSK